LRALLLLIGVAVPLLLGVSAQAASGAGTRAAGTPSAASTQDVMSALGISPNPPAELVFLVDSSDSMAASAHGLYPYVRQELPAYLEALESQQPEDQVVVITFGNPGTAQVIYGPGGPSPDIGLPADAHDGTTDFGQAFSLAIDQLSQPPAGIKVGGVVLLSDGGLDAPADSQYSSYSAPGWAQLRARAQGLPIPVTGYAVPLTTKPAYIADQQRALSTVFSPVRTLPKGTTNLSGALGVTGQQVVYGEVVSAVASDSGKDVQVTWSGLPAKPLNFTSPGQLDVKVTLTARTQKVPLYVTGLRLVAHGLPVTMPRALPDTGPLLPGASVTYPVRLTWQRETIGSSLTGVHRMTSGQLTLTGTVGSTWTPALQSAFDDLKYHPGPLSAAPVRLPAMAASASLFVYVLIALLVVLALLIAGLLRMLLFGSLTFSPVSGEEGALPLLALPVIAAGTMRLTGKQGWVIVRGSPIRKRMKVTLRQDGRTGSARLDRGGRTMITGIEIRHRPLFERNSRSSAEYQRW
jgi:hypothetical protein